MITSRRLLLGSATAGIAATLALTGCGPAATATGTGSGRPPAPKAAAATTIPDPCTLLTKDDITTLTGTKMEADGKAGANHHATGTSPTLPPPTV
ncbi:hypothetical protein [Fodinicola feengrottensis]|uniref:hypothetical protein n=1 Tax=Fodinicola feengrottensis TaxID=435914 RepID=UPI0013D682C9|nr:hypothetical protein [Fodinicola feengrottensis]